jgi:hypothetical protein
VLKKLKIDYRIFAILLTFMVLFRTVMCYLNLRAGESAERLLIMYLADNCINIVAAFLLAVLSRKRSEHRDGKDSAQ